MNAPYASLFCCLASCFALSANAGAQEPAPRSVLRAACGLTEVAGESWGAGPDYRVRFDTEAIEVTPVLGDRVSQHMPLRLALASIGRGDSQWDALPAGECTRNGHSVRYARPAFDEVYEVRAAGVEQSFVFRELPEGSGDLVVRLAVTTDLPLTHVARDQVCFELDGIGGVRIGAVTGIDARGQRVAGALHCAGQTLELSLPGAWVDSAALPIVLDPLIGTVLRFRQQNHDLGADIAYDETNDLYLVVWERRFSTADSDVRGQAVRADGQLVGGLVQVRTSPGVVSDFPSIGNVGRRAAFVAVWRENGSIRGAAIDAATRSASAPATIGTGVWPDIANEDADDDAIAVWFDPSQNTVESARVRVDSTGALVPFDHTTLGATVIAEPRISPRPGAGGRHLITWTRVASLLAPWDLVGVAVDRDLTPLGSPIRIGDAVESSSDGDGTSWTVAWSRHRAGDWDVLARVLTFDVRLGSLRFASPEKILEGDPGQAEGAPHVAWLGDSALIAYREEASGYFERDVFVESVDPFHCLPCEGRFALHSGPDDSHHPRIATRHVRGALTGDAMIAWYALDPVTRSGDILVQRFRADDGSATSLGGGCGNGGTAFATCPLTGNASFTMRVRGAAPSVLASLVLGARRLDAPCGTCVLVPDPFAGFVLPAVTTNSLGDAAVQVAIPASSGLVGAAFFQQWVVSPGSSCAGHDFSNALSVQIQ